MIIGNDNNRHIARIFFTPEYNTTESFKYLYVILETLPNCIARLQAVIIT